MVVLSQRQEAFESFSLLVGFLVQDQTGGN